MYYMYTYIYIHQLQQVPGVYISYHVLYIYIPGGRRLPPPASRPERRREGRGRRARAGAPPRQRTNVLPCEIRVWRGARARAESGGCGGGCGGYVAGGVEQAEGGDAGGGGREARAADGEDVEAGGGGGEEAGRGDEERGEVPSNGVGEGGGDGEGDELEGRLGEDRLDGLAAASLYVLQDTAISGGGCTKVAVHRIVFTMYMLCTYVTSHR
jgi:hypothetical protein